MATRAKFARLARYSPKCVEASHIFLKNSPKRVLASLASPQNTARRMSSSLASPRNTAWQTSASLASHNINTKRAENASASTRDIRKTRTQQIRCRVAIA
jgi:hypothetical protein